MNETERHMFCELAAAVCVVRDVVKKIAPNDMLLRMADERIQNALDLYDEAHPLE